MLTSQTTYTQARDNLATLLDKVVNDKEVIIIKRRDGRNVALIAEDELSSLLETVYLLRSPENAERLFSALEWSRSKDGKPVEPKKHKQIFKRVRKQLSVGLGR